MPYIYHAVPDPMIGDRLIPLTQQSAALRAKNLEKYRGRTEILKRNIPLLDCFWNDVVQFTPVHPQKIFALQKELGLISEIYPYKFYEIDINMLDPALTVVFFKTAPGEENTNVVWLHDIDFVTLQDIPEATIDYYKSLVGSGELPFNFQFIPHVVYKGEVMISGSKTIRVS